MSTLHQRMCFGTCTDAMYSGTFQELYLWWWRSETPIYHQDNCSAWEMMIFLWTQPVGSGWVHKKIIISQTKNNIWIVWKSLLLIGYVSRHPFPRLHLPLSVIAASLCDSIENRAYDPCWNKLFWRNFDMKRQDSSSNNDHQGVILYSVFVENKIFGLVFPPKLSNLRFPTWSADLLWLFKMWKITDEFLFDLINDTWYMWDIIYESFKMTSIWYSGERVGLSWFLIAPIISMIESVKSNFCYVYDHIDVFLTQGMVKGIELFLTTEISRRYKEA